MSKKKVDSQPEFFPLDPEIERIIKVLRKEQRLAKDKVAMEEQEALQTGLVFNPIVMANDRDHVIREYVVLCSMS